MVLLRQLLGDVLRRLRLRQGRTLREVSASARVSLGYLSEVERGQKEASSELLAAICTALGTPLSQVLREVSDNFALVELQTEPVFADVIEPAIEVTPGGHQVDDEIGGAVPVGPVGPTRMVGAAPGKRPERVGMQPGSQLRAGQVPVAKKVGVTAGSTRPISAGLDDPLFDQV